MDYLHTRSNLSIDALNKVLSIEFFHEIYKKNKNKLDKNDLILTISDGVSKIKDYRVETDDDIIFNFFLELNVSSDGEQLIFLNGNVFDYNGKAYQIKDQIVNLNKEYLYFSGDSIIKTDQGNIEIKNLDKGKYSIDNEKIISINKGVDPNIKTMVLFKRGSIKYNIPCDDTLLKSDQKIYFDNKYLEVQEIFFKYNNKVDLEIVKYENNYLYNILIDNIDYLQINDLNIKCSNYENSIFIDNYNYGYKVIENMINDKMNENFKKYNRQIDNIKKEINTLNDSISKLYINKEIILSLSHKINKLYNKIQNKNIINESKKIIIDSKKIITENKKNEQNNNTFNRLIWDHWVKYGAKENKKMNKIIIFENADFEKYKKDYRFLCNKLGNNDKKIWNHWIKNGNKENKIMHNLITFKNCDFDLYKLRYPSTCEKLNYDNKKIWNSWINLDKYYNVMEIKLNFENADFEKYKKDYPYLCRRIYRNLNSI